MAWYTHQILADFLNRSNEHRLVAKALNGTMSDDIVLHYGPSKYIGKNNVIAFFEETSKAISSDRGFRALPVIICNTEDPNFGFSEEGSYTAIALTSNSEGYISWFFLLRGNEQFAVDHIYAAHDLGYSFYPDVYTEGAFDYTQYDAND